MTLSEHFDKQSTNVLDYWDGKTDQDGTKLIKQALEMAIAHTPRSGGVIWFPAGNYDTQR